MRKSLSMIAGIALVLTVAFSGSAGMQHSFAQSYSSDSSSSDSSSSESTGSSSDSSSSSTASSSSDSSSSESTGSSSTSSDNSSSSTSSSSSDSCVSVDLTGWNFSAMPLTPGAVMLGFAVPSLPASCTVETVVHPGGGLESITLDGGGWHYVDVNYIANPTDEPYSLTGEIIVTDAAGNEVASDTKNVSVGVVGSIIMSAFPLYETLGSESIKARVYFGTPMPHSSVRWRARMYPEVPDGSAPRTCTMYGAGLERSCTFSSVYAGYPWAPLRYTVEIWGEVEVNGNAIIVEGPSLETVDFADIPLYAF